MAKALYSLFLSTKKTLKIAKLTGGGGRASNKNKKSEFYNLEKRRVDWSPTVRRVGQAQGGTHWKTL